MNTIAAKNVEITPTTQRLLEQIAEKLDISDAHHQAAERSYKSVGTWLSRPESAVAQYSPAIFSQGSFRLGTVIRPPTDEDCFDLDVVCELACSKEMVTQKQLKEAVGKELNLYAKRYGMQEIEPGHYCWTLHYADGAQFQMDVLPAVPDATHQRMLLEAQNLRAEWIETAIGLTYAKHPQYAVICNDWPPSNPRGYAAWFRLRMQQTFGARRRAIALAEGKADIEAIPEYRVKTPLQSVVQILKRHRDGTFADRPDVKPASIVLTTLAAHAYNQEETLIGALFSILGRMDLYIETRNGRLWIPNPSDPRENFADRWSTEPALKEAFDEWLRTARADFEAVASLTDEEAISEQLAERMGRALVEKATASQAPVAALTRRATALSRILTAPHKQPPSWPVLREGTVKITKATAARHGFRTSRFGNNGPALHKRCDLKFEAETDAKWPYDVYWQVVNTGQEARSANNLRGTFQHAAHVERGLLTRRETTRYTGSHSIECFIVKNGYCVAQSSPFIVNIK
jgi:hypothetical protein